MAWPGRFLLLTALAAVGQDETGERIIPPFLDYDCDLVDTIPGATANWNHVFERVRAGLNATDPAAWDFSLPPEYAYLVKESEDASKRRSRSIPAQAMEECPIGYLYLQLLNFYSLLNKTVSADREDPGLQPAATQIMELLGRFPTFALALSRWPVFFALEHFSDQHGLEEELFCQGVNGVVNWDENRALAQRWAFLKRGLHRDVPVPDDIGEELAIMEKKIAEQFFTVLRRPAHQNKAFEECEFGFYFLVANQMTAAANRQTHHMPPFNKIMDQVVGDMSFTKVGRSSWPIWAVLVIFSDLNKGIWFFGGDRKYLRGYSDWNLRRDELSPLVSPGLDFLSSPWKKEASKSVNSLIGLDHESYVSALELRAARREDSWGALRPITRSLLDAAQAVSASVRARGAGARLAYVVLLYGKAWARLLERLAGRMSQLDIAHPLLVIAIGKEAAAACRKLARGAGSSRPHDVVCWTPDTESQVHRFTGVHALLHLGVDVLYLDMDTFLLRDPTPRILASAEGWDALFARHADADCINIGIFYIRANGKTAVWMSQFLAWYHDHPFEIDQRGLHIFLGLPARELSIAYAPDDLVKIRGGVLDDVNEVVIGDVTWAGSLPKMLIFHWCHRPLEQKEQEINLAYDAADSLEPHNLPLSLAMSVASGANPGSAWAKVLSARIVLDGYKALQPPIRTPCW
eukprot:TRINITY_DN81622_c0_g1_i1.p1 TRINITY_DN81622_c0_g1~~TRINITY_DN81622_c0_g1_i1.p1  ORF type:complete len:690 (+),score=138.74 TRINITY_DN81622_c0_g1_i1:74-2143(+)